MCRSLLRMILCLAKKAGDRQDAQQAFLTTHPSTNCISATSTHASQHRMWRSCRFPKHGRRITRESMC